MSCGGWGVGNRCLAMQAFQVVTKQMNGPDISHSIHQGDEGIVQNVLDMHPTHYLSINWQRLGKTLTVPQDKFQFLRKILSGY